MAQWEHISPIIQDIILEFLDDDTWRDQHLSLVSRDWQHIMLDGRCQRRREGGTIVLRSPTDNFSEIYRTHGLTIATLYQLAQHYTQWFIPPNQYDHVQIIPNIQDYQRIRNPLHHFELDNTLQAQHIVLGGPFSYINITELDCHDNFEDLVTENWDQRHMDLKDLFYPGVHYNGLSVPHTFVANLLARFFTHVTSLNLSATIWSNHAVRSVWWRML